MKTIRIKTWKLYVPYLEKMFRGLATAVEETPNETTLTTIAITFNSELTEQIQKIIDREFSSYTNVA